MLSGPTRPEEKLARRASARMPQILRHHAAVPVIVLLMIAAPCILLGSRTSDFVHRILSSQLQYRRPGPEHASQPVQCTSTRQKCCDAWRGFYGNKSIAIERRTRRPSTISPIHGQTHDQRTPCARLLLIVIFNWPHFQNVDFIRSLYANHVTKMVFYSDKENQTLGVHRAALSGGFYQQRAIADAMKRYTEFDGYLWIGDDVFFNFPAVFPRRDLTKVWMHPPDEPPNPLKTPNGTIQPPGDHWYMPWGRDAAATNHRCLPELFDRRSQAHQGCRQCMSKGFSDIGYIPQHLVPPFMELAYVYRDVFFEFAVPTILRLMVDSVESDIELFEGGLYIWGPIKLKPAKAREQWQVQRAFFHSAKYSNIQQRADVKRWLRQSQQKFKIEPSKNRLCTGDVTGV